METLRFPVCSVDAVREQAGQPWDGAAGARLRSPYCERALMTAMVGKRRGTVTVVTDQRQRAEHYLVQSELRAYDLVNKL